MFARKGLRNILSNKFTRFYTQGTNQSQGTVSSSVPPPASKVNANVPGLSDAVVRQATEPLGPGVDPNKNGPYKVPEYFCYDNMSFFEAEIEMSKFRCPQPSALKK
ncbi:unnamed protein product [Euphydryas editha]|uniref:NADH dehydrogenase [ubiquinone] flavoprotein 3, mitochondrial n=1 Tax=Euphydryas editha TaxID=104508 RepID=A0AAU9TXK8_EUPED|nr:unnamed protein product [Euphydryas editha]